MRDGPDPVLLEKRERRVTVVDDDNEMLARVERSDDLIAHRDCDAIDPPALGEREDDALVRRQRFGDGGDQRLGSRGIEITRGDNQRRVRGQPMDIKSSRHVLSSVGVHGRSHRAGNHATVNFPGAAPKANV